MAGITGRFKKYQIAGLKLITGYGFSLVDLCSCRPRQIDIERITIDRFYKTGAVDPLAAGTPQSMAGAFPALILIDDALLDIAGLRVIGRFHGPVRIGVFSRRLFLACRAGYRQDR